jgi:AcrR family transcriptional regulator
MPTPSDPASKPRRRYDGSRRRAQAADTRAAIADAARALFLTNGWAGTTMRAVANRAGVAEPTVYAAYGNKSGLALALVSAIEADANADETHAELAAGKHNARRQLTALIAFDRKLFERSGDLIALLIDGGRSEPDLRYAYQHGRRNGDRIRRTVFESWAPGTLAPGVTPNSALDTYDAICNIHAYTILRDERSYTPAHIEGWWTRTLSQLLLA